MVTSSGLVFFHLVQVIVVGSWESPWFWLLDVLLLALLSISRDHYLIQNLRNDTVPIVGRSKHFHKGRNSLVASENWVTKKCDDLHEIFQFLTGCWHPVQSRCSKSCQTVLLVFWKIVPEVLWHVLGTSGNALLKQCKVGNAATGTLSFTHSYFSLPKVTPSVPLKRVVSLPGTSSAGTQHPPALAWHMLEWRHCQQSWAARTVVYQSINILGIFFQHNNLIGIVLFRTKSQNYS